MNKNDLRFVKTEDNIRAAFRSCVYEFGFQQTRISDICEKARISRNTFYSHYMDKYDLLDSMFYDLSSRFQESFTEEMGANLFEYEFDSSIMWYMTVVSQNRECCKLLLDCSYEKFLTSIMNAIVFTPMRRYIGNLDEKYMTDIGFQLNVHYMFYGMIAFTKTWLDHYDCISLEEATVEMKRLCIGPVSTFIEKLSLSDV